VSFCDKGTRESASIENSRNANAWWRIFRDSLLVASFLTYALGVSFYAYSEDPWSHGDWLINYADGFTRRGFSGELLAVLSDSADIPLKVVVASCQAVVFGLLLLVLRKYFLAHQTLLGYGLLFIPGSILWLFAEPSIVGRKDHLFLLVASLWIIWSSSARDRNLTFRHYVAASAGWLVVFLTHEGFGAFSPALSIFAFGQLRQSQTPFKAFSVSAIPTLAATGVVLTSMFFPKPSALEICMSLLTRGYSSRVCEGAVSWSERGLEDGFALILFRLHDGSYLPFYLAIFATQVTLLWILLKSNGSLFPRDQSFLWFIGATAFGSMTLAAVADDWGRWISMSTVVLLLGALARDTQAKVRPRPQLKFRDWWWLPAIFLIWGFSSANAQYTSPVENLLDFSYYVNGGMFGN
jgi:hypothetical protein